jgi:protein ImuA
MVLAFDPAQGSAPRGGPFPALESGLHEIYAATQSDAACLSGGALMLARRAGRRSCLWVRHVVGQGETGGPSTLGVAELGIDPARIVLLRAREAGDALQAGLEGVSCRALDAVIVELWGEAKAYDLVASRRLALAAKASGVPVLVARAAAHPMPSAAQMRWQVRTLPSRALAGKAPGAPALELTLLRARNGQEGLRYCLEWDRDARQFTPRPTPISGDSITAPAPLSGAVVPVSAHRQGALEHWRNAG